MLDVTSLEWLFRGDLNGSHHSLELDLSLCIWPPASTVQRIVVSLRMLPLTRKMVHELQFLLTPAPLSCEGCPTQLKKYVGTCMTLQKMLQPSNKNT